MRKALWFSRHTPTSEQLQDAHQMGYAIEVTPEGTALGSTNIQSEEDLDAVIRGLKALADAKEAVGVFGVFAVPVQAHVARASQEAVPCFGAWNISRTAEGGKPSFSHFKWLMVGGL